MLAEDFVLRTALTAFSRGPEGTITAWNASAEAMFGLTAAEVVGRRCCDVLAGQDAFGNDYCSESCACWRMTLRNRQVRPFRLNSRDAFGHQLPLRVSIVAAQGREAPELVHVMERAVSKIVFADFSDDVENSEPSALRVADVLTRRELEVLRLLSEGRSTRDIAGQLVVTVTTVRNHIARCLSKLNAHSRLEAVSIARRLDLV